MINEETRAEAFAQLDVNEKQRQVLECLGNKEMTAREVLIEMIKKGYTEIDDRNGVALRLTKLFEARKLVIVAKKMDIETGRMTAVYRRAYEEVH